MPPQNDHLSIRFLQLNKTKQLLNKFDTRKNQQIIDLVCEFNPDVIYQRGKTPETVIAKKIADKTRAHFIWASNSDKSGDRWKYSQARLGKKQFRLLPGLMVTFYSDIRIQHAIKKADLVLAQTRHQKNQLYTNYGINSILFRSGHPVPVFPEKKANAIPTVLWVANLTPIKRPLLFAKLAEQSMHLPAKFIMIGHPREPDLVKKIQEYSAVLPNFYYLGGATLRSINKIMKKVDIFTLSSSHEGIANTFIQACIHGLPTISLGHEPENWISQHKLGAVAADFNEWKCCIHHFIKNKNLRLNAGKRAYDFANRHLNMDLLVDKLLELTAVFKK
jgi:glycosyltransferase involved in cell wall biosynthesis